MDLAILGLLVITIFTVLATWRRSRDPDWPSAGPDAQTPDEEDGQDDGDGL
jgi:hypothetical protein